MSIRNQLLCWLLVPLGALCILSAVALFFSAQETAQTLYDEILLNSVDSVVARLGSKGSTRGVALSPSVVAVLRHNLKDMFYFQVLSADGKILDGDNVFPRFKKLPKRTEAVYGDAFINGEPVRTVLVQAPPEDVPDRQVFVFAGETLHARTELVKRILANIFQFQIALASFGVLFVYVAVRRGLTPLVVLQKAVSERSRSDLSPINVDSPPQEVVPLVEALNNLLSILREDLLAKQRFVANAAHQLRTPLAGLKTYIGILKKLEINERAVEVLNQLDSGADRTSHMINRLLALAKAEPTALGKPEHMVVDLNAIVSEAAAGLVTEAVKKNIDLSFDASESPALIMGDAAGLQELVANLVENAVRYTQEGGNVTVSVASGAIVQLLVQDNGLGIPPDERERVFERFYRIMGTSVSGSGLGLSIVREIALSHNARVLLGSGPDGQGTTVKVEFSKVKASNHSAAGSCPPGKGKNKPD